MEHTPDPQQVRAVSNFVTFLGDNLSRRSELFELEVKCTLEEINVLRTLALHGPMMVKEIAHSVPTMSLSKLTRVLDHLEAQKYITRTLNCEDRRSFVITLTEAGKVLISKFMQNYDELVQGILTALTPMERLMLAELFTKIQGNWQTSIDQENTSALPA